MWTPITKSRPIHTVRHAKQQCSTRHKYILLKEKITMFNCKKLLSLALAATMAASLAVPAFAATTSNTTKITGNYQAVTIDVTVPTTGTAIINPYGLPVVIYSKTVDSTTTEYKVDSAQIVTKPLAIMNRTDVDLDVNISYTASVTGTFTFAAAPIEKVAEDTKNEGFVYLAIESATDLKGADTGDSPAVTEEKIAESYSKVEWTEYNATTVPDNVLALKATTTAISKAKMSTLTAATMSETDGKFSEYAEGSIAFIGLCGNCAQNPKTAWVAKDGMVVNVAFTFTPNVA
jgi:hypothetical protein